MNAIIYKKTRGSLSLRTSKTKIPLLRTKEILVKVKASTLTTGDVASIKMGLLPSGMPITGSEFAGVIEQLGLNVSNFKVGDRIFGYKNSGAHAEYIKLSPKDVWASIPEDVSFQHAAAIPNGSMSALHFLKAAKASRGQNILIYGASGSVGSYAVQIAKRLGLHVTAVCSKKNMTMVDTLGADIVLDYNTNTFKNLDHKFDIIFDCVGKLDYHKFSKLVAKRGAFVTTQLNLSSVLRKITNIFSSYRYVIGIASFTKERLKEIIAINAERKLSTVIDRSFEMTEIESAFQYIVSGRKKGNVIINIDPDEENYGKKKEKKLGTFMLS